MDSAGLAPIAGYALENIDALTGSACSPFPDAELDLLIEHMPGLL
jgi:hypothetical protein